jgi:F-type H+-transporting ATPase subunit epsilon
MANLFPFEVHTPYRPFFSEQVEAFIITLVDGEICVYADHSLFTAPVVSGILKVKDQKGRWRSAFITEGIVEVKAHKTVLMVDAAEWPKEIDHERALAAKSKAEEILGMSVLKFEVDNARASLRRAQMRLKAWELRESSAEAPVEKAKS